MLINKWFPSVVSSHFQRYITLQDTTKHTTREWRKVYFKPLYVPVWPSYSFQGMRIRQG